MNWICRRKKKMVHKQTESMDSTQLPLINLIKSPNYELDNSGNKHLAYTVIIAVSLETPK